MTAFLTAAENNLTAKALFKLGKTLLSDAPAVGDYGPAAEFPFTIAALMRRLYSLETDVLPSSSPHPSGASGGAGAGAGAGASGGVAAANGNYLSPSTAALLPAVAVELVALLESPREVKGQRGVAMAT